MEETLFSVVDGRLVPLTPVELPTEVGAGIESIAERLIGQRLLTIGRWPNGGDPARPDLLVLGEDGIIRSFVSSAGERTPAERIPQIDAWLSTQTLRDLGRESADPLGFYEALWDLNPSGPIRITGRRYLLMGSAVPDGLAGHDVRALNFDAYSDGQTTVVVGPSELSPETTSEPLRELAPVIDLSDQRPAPPPPPPIILSAASDAPVIHEPQLRQGDVFQIDRLPLLFDPAATDISSISDELFAVGHHIVVVEPLRTRRKENPFERPDQFRWDAQPEAIQALNSFLNHPDGTLRTVHLFVEGRQNEVEYAVYIGELRRVAFQKRDNKDTAWFAINPALSDELFRLLKKRKLPDLHLNATVDLN